MRTANYQPPWVMRTSDETRYVIGGLGMKRVTCPRPSTIRARVEDEEDRPVTGFEQAGNTFPPEEHAADADTLGAPSVRPSAT